MINQIKIREFVANFLNKDIVAQAINNLNFTQNFLC
jgi:hypothetical protein